MILERIAQILDDLFGIPYYMVSRDDHLQYDWGIDEVEHALFNLEFCEEFKVDRIPPGLYEIEDYMALVEVE